MYNTTVMYVHVHCVHVKYSVGAMQCMSSTHTHTCDGRVWVWPACCECGCGLLTAGVSADGRGQ